jgi:hypothetical protein
LANRESTRSAIGEGLAQIDGDIAQLQRRADYGIQMVAEPSEEEGWARRRAYLLS